MFGKKKKDKPEKKKQQSKLREDFMAAARGFEQRLSALQARDDHALRYEESVSLQKDIDGFLKRAQRDLDARQEAGVVKTVLGIGVSAPAGVAFCAAIGTPFGIFAVVPAVAGMAGYSIYRHRHEMDDFNEAMRVYGARMQEIHRQSGQASADILENRIDHLIRCDDAARLAARYPAVREAFLQHALQQARRSGGLRPPKTDMPRRNGGNGFVL